MSRQGSKIDKPAKVQAKPFHLSNGGFLHLPKERNAKAARKVSRHYRLLRAGL